LGALAMKYYKKQKYTAYFAQFFFNRCIKPLFFASLTSTVHKHGIWKCAGRGIQDKYAFYTHKIISHCNPSINKHEALFTACNGGSVKCPA
jgi:hypothetical protein